jgi:hypothetical protein
VSVSSMSVSTPRTARSWSGGQSAIGFGMACSLSQGIAAVPRPWGIAAATPGGRPSMN